MFTKNENLRKLNLSNNVLRQFQPNLLHQTRLEILDLSFNSIVGFSRHTCSQFSKIKRSNCNFTVDITGNEGFECSCDNLYVLNFLRKRPEIFKDVSNFHCQLAKGSRLSYSRLAEFLPLFGVQCLAADTSVFVLVTFFLLTGGLAVFSLYHYKRWQWKYLYYMGRKRLHIGSTFIHCRSVAHAFVTYDQENRKLRRIMRLQIFPRLHQMGISTVFGEVDFCGAAQGLGSSIASAVASTGKTLVFLSKNIFQEFYRQTEVNMAIMHELYFRSPVLVPVLILDFEALPVLRKKWTENNQPIQLNSVVEENFEHPGQRMPTATRHPRGNTALTRKGNHRRAQQFQNFPRFMDLVSHFPPEISVFLQGQVHRCLVYTGDRELFWSQLRETILE
ncbi:Toll-like receptor 13 [Elysia marginata]|uniref:Toll-like receptor 13 n=1 Tax=Elysia marginata TaxID=1093978 RepID=A0AAV4JVS1_9GAST|nr:Toll-like receptor 13 [Elysia marginata]